MLCSFLSTGLLPPWLGLFLGTLFFLLLYQMGFFFLISISDISLLLYKNAFNFWILTLYPTDWPNSFIRSSRFFSGVYRIFYVHCGEDYTFRDHFYGLLLCTLSCHLQTMTVLLPPFQFGCLLFLFLVWLLCLELPILCWIEVVKVGSLVLFMSLVGKLLVFTHWILC